MTGPLLTTRYPTVDCSNRCCPECATALAPDARFCVECGASLENPVDPVALGAPEPLDAPADTIPLAVDDLEEIRCGEILEIESCVRDLPGHSSEEPDLVGLAFAERGTRSMTSAHTQVVGAIRLEIDTEFEAELDDDEIEPQNDRVPADAIAVEARAGTIELAAPESGIAEVETAPQVDDELDHELDEELELDVDVADFDTPEPAAPEVPVVEGTVVAMLPCPSMPYWPAPPRGETVIAAAPPEPPAGYTRWSA